MKHREQASVVLGFADYREPARRLADAAGIDYAEVSVHRFPDDESLVSVPPSLPAHVIFCRSLDHPDQKLIELELAAATALQLGAQRLTLVAPYLCYMRQDTAFEPGQAVSQSIIGSLLARRFDTLITVDPHLHRTATLQQAVPVRHAITLSAATAMAGKLEVSTDAPLLIGPDEESAQWVNAIAAPAGLEFGVARKQRMGDREVHIELPDMPVAGRDVVLVDDVASSGQTLIQATRQLCAVGANSVSVMVTHALFVDDAFDRLRASGVCNIVSTDSVCHSSNAIALADMLAQALRSERAL